jgi:hypothetical protein
MARPWSFSLAERYRPKKERSLVAYQTGAAGLEPAPNGLEPFMLPITPCAYRSCL